MKLPVEHKMIQDKGSSVGFFLEKNKDTFVAKKNLFMQVFETFSQALFWKEVSIHFIVYEKFKDHWYYCSLFQL